MIRGASFPAPTSSPLHEPTGTEYTGVTGADGQFHMLNVRAGGPYKITVRLAGFREQSQDNVNGRRSASRRRCRSGCSSRRCRRRSRSLPKPARSFRARSRARRPASVRKRSRTCPPCRAASRTSPATNPFVVQQSTNSNPSALSIAGRNVRYNNIQIDGAVNNDLFGLADPATPGGQAEHPADQPRRHPGAAARRVAVRRAPGRLLGRRHQRHHAQRHQPLQGHRLLFLPQPGLGRRRRRRPADRDLQRQAVRRQLGGPMVKNKAFFFANVEWQRRETPSGYSVDGSSGQTFGNARPTPQRILDIAQDAATATTRAGSTSSSATRRTTRSSCAATSTWARAS